MKLYDCVAPLPRTRALGGVLLEDIMHAALAAGHGFYLHAMERDEENKLQVPNAKAIFKATKHIRSSNHPS